MTVMNAGEWRIEAAEWRRPWKLLSFAAGLGLLMAGSYHYRAPDWDVPVSILMATLAYLTAPWSMRAMIERRWRDWPSPIRRSKSIPQEWMWCLYKRGHRGMGSSFPGFVSCLIHQFFLEETVYETRNHA